MDSQAEHRKILDLLIRLVENNLNDAELNFLVNWSKRNPKAVVEYCEFIKDYSIIRSLVAGEVDFNNDFLDDSQFNKAVWSALQEAENTAPGIRVPESEKPERREIPTAAPRKARTQVSKFSLITLLLSSAALIFLIVYAYLGPASRKIEAATLYDSIDTRWAEPDRVIKNGMRLFTKSDPLQLREGVAKILFDNGGTVVFEGPAEFKILTPNHIQMNYGRLYATIPQEATGFTVSTANLKVIDLGTEFGVQVHGDGASEVHVIKGKTSIAAVVGNTLKDIQTMVAGSAKYVDAQTKKISDINFEKHKFVRNIDSAHNIITRGRLFLDLTNITAGGNGIKAGKINVWLDPKQGYSEFSIHEHDTSAGYLPIPSNPYVDGLFVPGGQKDSQIISSERDVFQDCPQTSGLFYANLGVNPDPSFLRVEGRRDGTISFFDTIYGTRSNPCLVMHANLGITYDLRAIRNEYSDWELTRFVAKIGIADLREPYPCNADFWVLIDGQVRYSLKNCRYKANLLEIAVELRETDRFLTLVTTDGGDRDVPEVYKRAITCDWCVFAEPVLELR